MPVSLLPSDRLDVDSPKLHLELLTHFKHMPIPSFPQETSPNNERMKQGDCTNISSAPVTSLRLDWSVECTHN